MRIISDTTRVTVIDTDGKSLGNRSYSDVKHLADEKQLDIIILSDKDANNIVVKIGNKSKFLYDQQKKKQELQKKQRQAAHDTKEIWIRPGIGENDFQTKINSAKKFLQKGNKVKLTLKFKGREMLHSNESLAILNKFSESLKDISKVDGKPSWGPRMVSIIIVPLK